MIPDLRKMTREERREFFRGINREIIIDVLIVVVVLYLLFSG